MHQIWMYTGVDNDMSSDRCTSASEEEREAHGTASERRRCTSATKMVEMHGRRRRRRRYISRRSTSVAWCTSAEHLWYAGKEEDGRRVRHGTCQGGSTRCRGDRRYPSELRSPPAAAYPYPYPYRPTKKENRKALNFCHISLKRMDGRHCWYI